MSNKLLLYPCTATAIRELCHEKDTCDISDIYIRL